MADPFLENPCKTGCAYGECSAPGSMQGCGGCCGCLRGCYAEYELEQAMIPETPEQYRLRQHWEAVGKVLGHRTFPL